MVTPDRLPDGAAAAHAPAGTASRRTATRHRPAAAPAPPLRVVREHAGGTRTRAGTQTNARAGVQARPQALARPATSPGPQSMPRVRPARPQARRPVSPTRGAQAPRRPAPRRGRGRDYIEHLDVTQAICWQLALLAVIITINQPTPVFVITTAAAGAVVALTAVRVRGRWLYQLTALAIGFVNRDHGRDLPESASKTPALLAQLVPGTTVTSVDTSHGSAMTVSQPDGLAAILQPTTTRDPIPVLPPPSVLLPDSGDGSTGHHYGVQTIFHAGVRRSGPPKVWLAVQAVRTVDTPHDEELILVLRNALRRVRRSVGRAGVPTEPLAEQAAFAVVAGLAHVTGGRNEIREDWRFWRTGPVSQATYRIDGLDNLEDPRRMVAGMFALTQGVAVTVALGARSGREGTRTGGVLRLAATTEAALRNAHAALSARAIPREIRLSRLDGTHSSGVAASLPIGVMP